MPKLSAPGSREHPMASLVGAHFSLRPITAYYADMRFLSYFCQNYSDDIQEKADNLVKGIFPSLKTSRLGSLVTKNSLNWTEAGLFTVLSALNLRADQKDLHSNCDLAVRAELGIPEGSKVTGRDLSHSRNPLVVSDNNRFFWQYVSRLGSSLGFIHHLRTGIILNAVTITAERTIFYPQIALDKLVSAVNDVQINNLDTEATKTQLVMSLIKVLQQARIDHRQPTIPVEQVDALKPTLEKIALDVIDKKFGVRAMVYIMGGGVIIPENPEQTRKNYDHVRDVMVTGIIAERSPANDNKGRSWSDRVGGHKIAESARPEELIRQQDRLNGRGRVHSVTAVDTGRGGGLGAGF